RFPRLSGRRQEIQVPATALGDSRHDAGSIPREMGPALGLSDGRAELCRGAIAIGEAVGAWSTSQERRAGQEGGRRRAEQAGKTGEGEHLSVDSVSIRPPTPIQGEFRWPRQKSASQKLSSAKRRPFAR